MVMAKRSSSSAQSSKLPPSPRLRGAGKAQSFPEGLTFDDVLLLPGFTDFKRQDADLATVLHPTIKLSLPIISSPMDTVTEDQMAIAMAAAGGLGVIHRNLAPDKQAAMVKRVKSEGLLVGAAIGVGPDMEERVKLLMASKADVIVVDSGHGHAQAIIDAVKYIKKLSKKTVVMAGNIATADGAKALIKAGVDILRVGVGPGSICTTRIVTGMGVPQVTAIVEVAKVTKGTKVTMVADGGIRQMGDMAKALACGAHAVMLGSMLAGHDEAPGEIVTIDDKKYKQYRGMGSVASMKKGSAERYGQSKTIPGTKLIAEGVEGLVPAKGKVSDFLYQASGALQSALYYIGARTVPDFHKKARFIRITNAGLRESHPHTIRIENTGDSYMI